MKKKQKNIFIDRYLSLGFAFKGMIHLLKTENAIKVHTVSVLLLTIIGCFFKLSVTEWMFQFLVLGFVITVEAINTAIEEIADFVQPNFDKKIGTIKDISAGAVLFSGVFGAVVIAFIYVPKIMEYLN